MSPLQHRSSVQHTGKSGVGGRQGNAGGHHRLPGGRHLTVSLRMRNGETPYFNIIVYNYKRWIRFMRNTSNAMSQEKVNTYKQWVDHFMFLQASFRCCMEVYDAEIAVLVRKPTLAVSIFWKVDCYSLLTW